MNVVKLKDDDEELLFVGISLEDAERVQARLYAADTEGADYEIR